MNSKSKKIRNNLILRLKKNKVQTSIYYPHPVSLLNYYKKKYKYNSKEFKNSMRIAYNSISFPVGPHISKKDIHHMSKTIKNLIG